MSGMHRDRVKRSQKERRHGRFRLAVQLAAAALLNGYAVGFLKGKIFTGGTKYICVPVLNCHSCPGALGACPIGAMQAVASGGRHHISFYVLGTLMLFGTVLGRLLCGFICPFGFVQDLLHKIPLHKIKVPEKLDKVLRWLKYIILAVFVILLPAVALNDFGTGESWFCKYICPAGTLESGFPLVLMNEQIRELVGALFSWKTGVLVFIVLGSVFIHRFFCRYFCPLGAFYSLFSKFSLYRMNVDSSKCVGCGKCGNTCPMAVDVTKNINSAECIRCGKCKAVCPTGAITSGFETGGEENKENVHTDR